MTLSQARLKLKQMVNEQINLLVVFLRRKRLIKGGVCLSRSRCGKPNCRCVKEGKLHVAWKLYWTEGGKTHLKALKKHEVYDYQRLTANYQRFRKVRGRLVKIHREMIALVNRLEQGMTKSSVKRYVGRRAR